MIYKNGGCKATIIVKKEDNRFVDSLDILRGMSKNWIIDEYDTETILIHVDRDNFIDVVKDIAGWASIAKSFCGVYLFNANESLEELGVETVECALMHRDRCIEMLEEAEAILAEAEKYGLQ